VKPAGDAAPTTSSRRRNKLTKHKKFFVKNEFILDDIFKNIRLI
jgi:hypothetical protein